MKPETNMVKMLEKQYQERLEEEVAKVNLWFIWKIMLLDITFQFSENVDFLWNVLLTICFYTFHIYIFR